jgi:thiol-disulfide isomerase/thioredoxin
MNDGSLTDPVAPPAPRPGVRPAWLLLGAAGLLLVGALAGATLWGRPGPATEAVPAFDVIRGALGPAAEFTLSGLDGRAVSLREFRGRVVLLNFWATWCVPCREEIPAMQALARDLGPRGLVVLALNYEEDPETVQAFVRDTGLTLAVLLDRDGAVARRYRVAGLPTSFFIDRRGAVAGSVIGFRDWAAPPAQAYVRGLLGAGQG